MYTGRKKGGREGELWDGQIDVLARDEVQCSV